MTPTIDTRPESFCSETTSFIRAGTAADRLRQHDSAQVWRYQPDDRAATATARIPRLDAGSEDLRPIGRVGQRDRHPAPEERFRRQPGEPQTRTYRDRGRQEATAAAKPRKRDRRMPWPTPPAEKTAPRKVRGTASVNPMMAMHGTDEHHPDVHPQAPQLPGRRRARLSQLKKVSRKAGHPGRTSRPARSNAKTASDAEARRDDRSPSGL